MRCTHAVLLLTATLIGAGAYGQEKPAAEKQMPVPLIIQVVFTEYEGEKKISSLPYSMPVNTEVGSARPYYQLRMGVRVPLTVSGKDDAAPRIQYMDVGTDIDCRARSREAGYFEVDLQLERSSIYSVGGDGKHMEWDPDDRLGVAPQPIIRRYRSTMELLMKDGQTIRRSIATDPLSGRVLKVDVTLNVVK
ncbi:MAG: hypothetical protein ACRD5G_00345 [Candidatus Acidiferrales bacterium]